VRQGLALKSVPRFDVPAPASYCSGLKLDRMCDSDLNMW
jgi:hypothetical protein